MDAHAFSASAQLGQKINVRKNMRAEIKFGFLKKATKICQNIPSYLNFTKEISNKLGDFANVLCP